MKTPAITSFAALLVAVAGAAYAHHGWSEYDASKPLRLGGVITESGYEHPHGHVQLQTTDRSWAVVLAPPSRMSARGLTAATLKPGTQAEVVGYPSRSKPHEMRAERITIGDRTVELR